MVTVMVTVTRIVPICANDVDDVVDDDSMTMVMLMDKYHTQIHIVPMTFQQFSTYVHIICLINCL